MPQPKHVMAEIGIAITRRLTEKYGPPIPGDRLSQMAAMLVVRYGLIMLKATGASREDAHLVMSTAFADWDQYRGLRDADTKAGKPSSVDGSDGGTDGDYAEKSGYTALAEQALPETPRSGGNGYNG